MDKEPVAGEYVVSEMVYITEQEVQEQKAFAYYLYANWLILKCKEVAVRVSPKTWAGIEDRMLRVPT
jgi:hypothetical protein